MQGIGHQDAFGKGGEFSKGTYFINRKQKLRGQGPTPQLARLWSKAQSFAHFNPGVSNPFTLKGMMHGAKRN